MTLIYCFLLCVFLCNTFSTAAPQSGTFVKPSSNTDERIIEIQNKLLNVQSQILALKLSLKTDGDTELAKGRLASLEEAFQSLKEELNDERRRSAADNAKYEHAIATLTNYYEKLEKEMQEMKASTKKETTDPETVAKVIACTATILPLPFGIFSAIPCAIMTG